MTKNTSSVVTNKKLDEAVEAMLNGMDLMLRNLREENSRLHEETSEKIDRFKSENAGQHAHIRDDISYLKAMASTAPTREEFENMKKRLQKLEVNLLKLS